MAQRPGAVRGEPNAPTTRPISRSAPRATATDLYVIKYIEPAINNVGALGFDAGSESSRRAAIERAVRTGLPSLTGPINLVQATGSGPGLLLAVPVYRYGADPPTPDKRQAVLVGLMYSPVVVGELLGDHGSFNTVELDYELVDSTAPGNEALLHRAGTHAGPGSPTRLFQDVRTFDIGGRNWTVRAGSTPKFEATRAARVPAVIASLGAVISALLALLVWHLGTRRARAEALAGRATAELATERQRLADIIDGANVGTWEMDIATGACRFDERWAEGIGYTLAELDAATFDAHTGLTRTDALAIQVHPDDLSVVDDALKRHYAGQTDHFECEFRMQHKAGHWLWMLGRGRICAWDPAGKPRVIAGTRMDISERKAAKSALADMNTALERRVAKRTAQLQRAVNDLQAFGYSIAHDIRQPLISMDGFTRMLARELGADPTSRAAHYLERLRAGVKQIGDAVRRPAHAGPPVDGAHGHAVGGPVRAGPRSIRRLPQPGPAAAGRGPHPGRPGGARRRTPASAVAGHPDGQRLQVQPRQGHGGGDRGHGNRRPGPRGVPCQRPRRWLRHGARRAAVRAVPAPAPPEGLRRPGHRPGQRAPHRVAPQRPHLGRRHARRGRAVFVHAGKLTGLFSSPMWLKSPSNGLEQLQITQQAQCGASSCVHFGGRLAMKASMPSWPSGAMKPQAMPVPASA